MTTILLVDDEPGNVTLISVLLRVEGYEVIRAMEPEDVISRAAIEQPNLILIDWIRPTLEPVRSLCRRLREAPRTRSIPIVVLADQVPVPPHTEPGLYDELIETPKVLDMVLSSISRLIRRSLDLAAGDSAGRTGIDGVEVA